MGICHSKDDEKRATTKSISKIPEEDRPDPAVSEREHLPTSMMKVATGQARFSGLIGDEAVDSSTGFIKLTPEGLFYLKLAFANKPWILQVNLGSEDGSTGLRELTLQLDKTEEAKSSQHFAGSLEVDISALDDLRIVEEINVELSSKAQDCEPVSISGSLSWRIDS